MPKLTIDGKIHEAAPGERLINLFNRGDATVPHVCYHPRLGPIQTCDTCLVEIDGKLVRACATQAREGMVVSSGSTAAKSAQRAAFDRVLGNHLLYCTVCDNNNGNCAVHNTTKLLAVEHQRIPFRAKPYPVHLESSAAHRQLHAAGYGRLPAARAQQRAGSKRPRFHAERPPRLPIGRRPGGAGALRGSLAGRDARHPRARQLRDGGRDSGRCSRRISGEDSQR
jgi:aerobic-type carbon monoxide dehydrogenase small subunit (CoxS/CutS family)